MAVPALDATTFDSTISAASKPVLVDFWASWCGPCRILSPIVEEIASEMSNSMDVYKCSVEENQDLAMRYQVMSIPTLMLFKEGKPVYTMVGAVPKAKIVEELTPLL